MGELYNFLQIYTPYILLPIVLIGTIFWIISMFYFQRLTNYLKTNKPERFKELTEVNIFVSKFPGGIIRYFFGTLDDEDQIVINLKMKYRKFVKLAISLFVGGPLLFIALFVIAMLFIKN